MDKPLVSIVMPVFNVAGTIEEAVASARSQRVEDLEIVVVDDGSTDDTPVIVERLAGEDGRIRLIRQENAGCPAARSRGFEAARGEFVSTLDGDDLWPVCKLEEQLAALEKHPDAVVIGGMRRFSGDNGDRRWLRKTMPFAYESRGQYLVRLLEAQNDEMALFNTFCTRRDNILDENFDPAIETAHDWEVWLRLAAKHRFVTLQRVHQYYRKHPGSATRRRPMRRAIDCQFMVLRKHLPASGLAAKERHRLLTRQVVRIARRCMHSGDFRDAWYALSKGLGIPAAYLDREYHGCVLRNLKHHLMNMKNASRGKSGLEPGDAT
jgi:glycosyltransferase involved in cell wall biosynthesis